MVTPERGDMLPRTSYAPDLLQDVSKSSMTPQQVVLMHEAVYGSLFHAIRQPQLR